ncbi:MAG TPA: hypothetical protein VNV63_05325, partial [Nitrospiria bacterium]|nr:hypothetical protein [Nitrospiria bacterium]
KAVEADPAAYGVTVGSDPKANKAAVDARVEQMFVKAEFGIQSLADQFGKTGYEVQRDNDQLTGLMKEFGLDGHSKTSWLDQNPPTLTYPDGKTTTVGSGYMGAMLHEFITKPSENAGVMAYRDTPDNPDGKSPETLDSERKFLYQFVKNHLMTQKGKQAMTSDQADAFLKRTALGQPISAKQGIGPPPQAPSKQVGIPPPPQAGNRLYVGAFGVPAFGAPPQPGGSPQAGGQQQPAVKMYMVPGYESPVQLSEEEAAKAKAANIPIEELSPEVMNQFLGK